MKDQDNISSNKLRGCINLWTPMDDVPFTSDTLSYKIPTQKLQMGTGTHHEVTNGSLIQPNDYINRNVCEYREPISISDNIRSCRSVEQCKVDQRHTTRGHKRSSRHFDKMTPSKAPSTVFVKSPLRHSSIQVSPKNMNATHIPYLPPVRPDRIYRLLMDSPRSFSEKHTLEENIMCEVSDIHNETVSEELPRCSDTLWRKNMRDYTKNKHVSKRIIQRCSSDLFGDDIDIYCQPPFYTFMSHPLEKCTHYSLLGKRAYSTSDVRDAVDDGILGGCSCSECKDHFKDIRDGFETGKVSVEDLHEFLNCTAEPNVLSHSDTSATEGDTQLWNALPHNKEMRGMITEENGCKATLYIAGDSSPLNSRIGKNSQTQALSIKGVKTSFEEGNKFIRNDRITGGVYLQTRSDTPMALSMRQEINSLSLECPVKLMGSLATKRWISAIEDEERVQKCIQRLRNSHIERSTWSTDGMEIIDNVIREMIDPSLPDYQEVLAAFSNDFTGIANCDSTASERRMRRSMFTMCTDRSTGSCDDEVVLSYIGSDKVWSTTKRLGFPSPTTSEQIEAEVKAYIRLVQQEKICEGQWNSALQGVPLFGSATLDTCELLRKLARKHCIPASLRGLMWMTLSGVSLKMDENDGFFKLVINKFGMTRDTNYDVIERDLGRTFPDHPYFAPEEPGKPEGIGLKRLRLILHALCWRNPLLGYCQSFNFIAAILLLVFDDDEATFFMMCHILEHLLPNDYYSEGLMGVKIDQEVFVDLLWSNCPKIAEHFAHLKFSAEALVPSWIMSLYVNVFPIETVLRVWDCMMTEGRGYYSTVPLSVLLAFIKIHSETILKTVDAGDLMVMLNRIASIEYGWDKLVKYAQDINLKPSNLHNSRRKVRDELLIEAERRKKVKSEYKEKQQGKIVEMQEAAFQDKKMNKGQYIPSSMGEGYYNLSMTPSRTYINLTDDKERDKCSSCSFMEEPLEYVIVETCAEKSSREVILEEGKVATRMYKVVGFQFDGSRRKASLDNNGNVVCVASDIFTTTCDFELNTQNASMYNCNVDKVKDAGGKTGAPFPYILSTAVVKDNITSDSEAVVDDNIGMLHSSPNSIHIPLPCSDPQDVVNIFCGPPTPLGHTTGSGNLNNNYSDIENYLCIYGNGIISVLSSESKRTCGLDIEMKEIGA